MQKCPVLISLTSHMPSKRQVRIKESQTKTSEMERRWVKDMQAQAQQLSSQDCSPSSTCIRSRISKKIIPKKIKKTTNKQQTLI